MKPFEHKKIERVRYWEGQLLRSGDFREIAGVEAQRRWWHNRAIHDAYGVREGFQLKLAGTPRRVIVFPGIAYDCFGRELILCKPQAVPLPVNLHLKKLAPLSLLIRYCEPRCESVSARIPQVCLEQECALVTGTVEFHWRAGAVTHSTDGVAIGILLNYSPQSEALEAGGETPLEVQDTDGTRFDAAFLPARPVALAHPLLISGTTVAGNTAWVPWNVPVLINETLFPNQNVGVSSVIDTSAAGFTEVPYYLASLQGPIWNAKSQSILPSLVTSISDETLTSFTFNIMLQTTDPQPQSVMRVFQPASRGSTNPNVISDPAAFLLFAQQQNLFISWFACQMPHTSPPAVDESMALDQILGSVLQANSAGTVLE